MNAVSKLFGRGDDTLGATAFGQIDYLNSRFHNTLLGRTDTTMVVSEVVRAQTEQRAFERARDEELKRNMEAARQQN